MGSSSSVARQENLNLLRDCRRIFSRETISPDDIKWAVRVVAQIQAALDNKTLILKPNGKRSGEISSLLNQIQKSLWSIATVPEPASLPSIQTLSGEPSKALTAEDPLIKESEREFDAYCANLERRIDRQGQIVLNKELFFEKAKVYVSENPNGVVAAQEGLTAAEGVLLEMQKELQWLSSSDGADGWKDAYQTRVRGLIENTVQKKAAVVKAARDLKDWEAGCPSELRILLVGKCENIAEATGISFEGLWEKMSSRLCREGVSSVEGLNASELVVAPDGFSDVDALRNLMDPRFASGVGEWGHLNSEVEKLQTPGRDFVRAFLKKFDGLNNDFQYDQKKNLVWVGHVFLLNGFNCDEFVEEICLLSSVAVTASHTGGAGATGKDQQDGHEDLRPGHKPRDWSPGNL
ncbi:hypothetical protein ACFCXT_23335 [Streptomyces vinaceus]|uniref:hypothetical protein n=1 Tax=Streptomyces vinaceus TaxID=1960 RepID=UPI0035E3B173